MKISDRIAHRMRLAKAYTAKSTQAILASKYKRIATHFANGITQRKVEEYVASRIDDGAQPSTVNYELACLRSILEPSDKVVIRKVKDRRERERIYLTEDEILRLLAHMDSPMQRMAMAYLYTGCRLEELRAVTLEDVTDRAGFVRIHNRKTAQSGYDHTRYVPLHENAVGLLPLDTKISTAQFRGALNRAAKKSGIGIRVTPKVFRSTAASHLVQQGVPMETVAAVLGHSSTAITQKHYAHLSPQNLVSAISLLPRLSSQCSMDDAANTEARQ